MLTAPTAAADDRSFVRMAAIAGMISLSLAVGNLGAVLATAIPPLISGYASARPDRAVLEWWTGVRLLVGGSPSPAGGLRLAGNAGRRS